MIFSRKEIFSLINKKCLIIFFIDQSILETKSFQNFFFETYQYHTSKAPIAYSTYFHIHFLILLTNSHLKIT